jgi:hypothetical protein
MTMSPNSTASGLSIASVADRGRNTLASCNNGTFKPALFAALIAAASLLLLPSHAAGYTMLGSGGASCEAWLATRRAPRGLDAAMQQQWLLGFLSGIGSMVLGELDPLRRLDADAVYAWLDGYCSNRPAESIEAAARVFIQEHPR